MKEGTSYFSIVVSFNDGKEEGRYNLRRHM